MTKKRLYLPAIIGFVLIVLSILAAMSGPIGSRIGWWDFDYAVAIAKWSAYVAMFGALLCFSGLIFARPGSNHRGFIISLLGIILFVPMLLFLQSWKEAKLTSPPIQDITTTTENLPTFWYAPNSRDYGGDVIAALQEEFYPDIKPLILPVSMDKAFDLSVELINDYGWQLWAPSRDEMHIEATQKTFWFGFSDDVVIHITKIDQNNSRIDMRSSSRFGGGGDGGTNANRIRMFFSDLKERSQQ